MFILDSRVQFKKQNLKGKLAFLCVYWIFVSDNNLSCKLKTVHIFQLASLSLPPSVRFFFFLCFSSLNSTYYKTERSELAFFRISSYNLGRAHAKTSLSLHFKSRIKKKWEKKKKREGKILLGGQLRNFGNFKPPLLENLWGETQNIAADKC